MCGRLRLVVLAFCSRITLSKNWKKHFMMNLHVDDVDTRFKHIQEANVTEKYFGTSLSLLKLEDWRVIVMHLIDPTGFL